MAKKKIQKYVNIGISSMSASIAQKELAKARSKISIIKQECDDQNRDYRKSAEHTLWVAYRNQLESFVSIPF